MAYMTTSDAASFFGLSRDWLDERKANGTFKRGKHYLQRESGGVIIWSIDEIEKWFNGDDIDDEAHAELIAKMVS